MVEIELSDGTIIKLRPPKVRDMRIVSHIKNDVEQEMSLIGNLTGLTMEELDEMTFKDYGLIQSELKSFLS